MSPTHVALLWSSFLLLVSAFAQAQTGQLPLLWCNGCTPAQKNTVALTQPPGATAYVGDVVSKAVSAYTVYIDVDDGTRPPTRKKVAQPIPVDPAYKEAADAYINFYNAAPVGWAKTAQVHYDGPGSGDRNVYDVVNRSPSQNELLDWSRTDMRVDFGTYLQSVLSKMASFNSQNGPRVDVVIIFWDGSRITLRLNTESSHGDNQVWDVVPDTGQDSNKNPVLSTKTNDPVNFRFNNSAGGKPTNPTDFSRWTTQMVSIGYNVSSGPRGGTWACTSGNGVSHCEYVTQ